MPPAVAANRGKFEVEECEIGRSRLGCERKKANWIFVATISSLPASWKMQDASGEQGWLPACLWFP